MALGAPELADAAVRCATALLRLHLVDGRLRRASLGGRVGESAAILEDHAMLATGLLTLYQLTTDDAWLTTATDLLDIALAHFADPDRPGRWFDSADDGEQLLLRPADPLDGATPSGASSIAEALLTAAHLVDADRADRYRQAAADTLQAHSLLLARAPRSAGHWLAVAEAAVRGPLQVAVACEPPGRRCWPTRAGSRPAGRSSSAAPRGHRSCWSAATGWPALMRPMCAAAGSATCRSPRPTTSRRLWPGSVTCHAEP